MTKSSRVTDCSGGGGERGGGGGYVVINVTKVLSRVVLNL